jgi:hypothetical protein
MIRKKRMLTLLSQGRLLEKRSPKMNSFESFRERPWRCSFGLRAVGLSYVILAYFVSCPFLSFWSWSWNLIKCWLLVGYQLVSSLRAILSSNAVIVSWFYWKLSVLNQSSV